MGAASGWFQAQFDDVLLAGGDVGFAVDYFAVVHARREADVGGGGRVDVPARGEDLSGEADGLGEVAGHFREGGNEEIAEAVAFESRAGAEAVAEETGDEMLVLGERDHAVAEVTGRQHVEVFAQAAAGASVVGDGDDGGEVADEAAVSLEFRLCDALEMAT